MKEMAYAAAQQLMEVLPRLKHRLHEVSREHTLTPGQFRCLMILNRQPMTLSELAEKYEVSAPTMSRMVSALVERGLVSRAEDPSDRRLVNLAVLPAGRAAWEEMLEDSRAHLAQFLEQLTLEELTHLSLGLQGLARLVARPE